MTDFDPAYPMFVLAFCVFRKSEYAERITPSLQRLKFRHFGHDMVVLHEREIRKCKPPFHFLMESGHREAFLSDLNQIVAEAEFSLIACAIYEKTFVAKHGADCFNPYHVALESCLQRLQRFLERNGDSRRTFVIFEQRGCNEDRDLELEFRRVVSASAMPFEMVLANKKVNSCGLQLADLVARPIGRRLLDGPKKRNRAFEILHPKMRIGTDGEELDDCFVDVFPRP